MLGLVVLAVGLLVEVLLRHVKQPLQLDGVIQEVPDRLLEPLMYKMSAWVEVVPGDLGPSPLQGRQLGQQRPGSRRTR